MLTKSPSAQRGGGGVRAGCGHATEHHGGPLHPARRHPRRRGQRLHAHTAPPRGLQVGFRNYNTLIESALYLANLRLFLPILTRVPLAASTGRCWLAVVSWTCWPAATRWWGSAAWSSSARRCSRGTSPADTSWTSTSRQHSFRTRTYFI